MRSLSKISNEYFPQFSANSKKPIKYSGTLEQNLKLFSVDPEIKGKSLQIREARYNELISEGKKNKSLNLLMIHLNLVILEIC